MARYIAQGGKWIPIEEYRAQPRSSQSTDAALWGDRHYEGMKAPDGQDISSRTKHREYMKANNVTTADDFSNTWKKAAIDRAAYYQEGRGGAFSRTDVARAIAQLESRKK